MAESVLSQSELGALLGLDTCMVSNAIETFKVRLRNTGFTDSSVHCFSEELPPMVGYAATAHVRSEDPPVDKKTWHDRSEWWRSILEIPAPRIVVLQDMDDPPGRGAFIGDVHAAILQALGCVGVVTNGAVRELLRIQETGFHLFARNVAVSHSYAHVFHLGATVKIGGLEVRPGDLLHGDRHGIVNIPLPIASRVPAVAAGLSEKENKLIAQCRVGQISLDELREIVRVLE